MDKPVDRQTAARFLAERYGPDAVEITELDGGDWSRAFAFRIENRDLVVRFGRYGEAYLKDRKAIAFAGPDLPVPAVMEIGEAYGVFYAISERYFGAFLETLDAQGWRKLMPALLRGLDHLREAEAPGSGVEWASEDVSAPLRWRQWLVESLEDRPGAQVGGWRASLRETPAIEEIFVSGERALRSLLPDCPEMRHVIHRDLLNRNVLVAHDASRLQAVFDWGCSLAGDFLYELAWFTFWAPWYPALNALDVRRVFQDHYRSLGLEVENFDRRLACYEIHIGLEHIAYTAFTGRKADQQDVVRRTIQVLESTSL
ncbi:MAG TPA: phosphotransferase [Chthonomonadaceae bacterium]|nr:phosphotransferase [Chthonomonadaceae bacterium]